VLDTPPGFGSLVAAPTSIADEALIPIVAEPLACERPATPSALSAPRPTRRCSASCPRCTSRDACSRSDQLEGLATLGVPVLDRFREA
jgi:hypothetical protein